jgi:hypothetical protein
MFLPAILVVTLSASAASAWPRGVDQTIFAEEPGPQNEPRPGKEGSAVEAGEAPDSRDSKIIGVSLLGSGLFLCSWGISAWEVEEYQCCPAHNTGNVVKIVAGIVLINAGLIYLLEAEG